jgi:hypothetical protein
MDHDFRKKAGVSAMRPAPTFGKPPPKLGH